MSSVNQVILIGNLGKDPETFTMKNSEQVSKITIATTEYWKDSKTEWHSVILYKKLSEIASKYLKKGSQVYINGRIETKQYTDKNGVERYQTNIIANDIKMLGNKTSNSNKSPNDNSDESDVPF